MAAWLHAGKDYLSSTSLYQGIASLGTAALEKAAELQPGAFMRTVSESWPVAAAAAIRDRGYSALQYVTPDCFKRLVNPYGLLTTTGSVQGAMARGGASLCKQHAVSDILGRVVMGLSCCAARAYGRCAKNPQHRAISEETAKKLKEKTLQKPWKPIALLSGSVALNILGHLSDTFGVMKEKCFNTLFSAFPQTTQAMVPFHDLQASIDMCQERHIDMTYFDYVRKADINPLSMSSAPHDIQPTGAFLIQASVAHQCLRSGYHFLDAIKNGAQLIWCKARNIPTELNPFSVIEPTVKGVVHGLSMRKYVGDLMAGFKKAAVPRSWTASLASGTLKSCAVFITVLNLVPMVKTLGKSFTHKNAGFHRKLFFVQTLKATTEVLPLVTAMYTAGDGAAYLIDG